MCWLACRRRRDENFTSRREPGLPAVGEIDRLAVWGPLRGGAAPFGVGDQLYVGAVGIHDEDLVARVAVAGEDDASAVGRPFGPSIEGRMIGEVADVLAVRVHHEHLAVVVEELAKSDSAPIG